jgi:HSP20 family protein
MTVIKWKPTAYSPIFSDFWNNFYKDLSNFAGHEGTFTIPAVNISELPEGYRLEVAAPGLNKDDFNLSVEKNLLTISVNKESRHDGETNRFTRKEYSFNSFSRTFQVPETADTEKITAKYENGILEILVPMKVEQKDKAVKTITIQ